MVSSLIKRMLAYSAIKISANPPALYSTLKPDTSSDSPSAKSNGVRFVSARHEINHVDSRGRVINAGHVHLVWARVDKLNEHIIHKSLIKIRAKLTS